MKTQRTPTPTVVSALTARTQFGQILRRVRENRERFLVDRRGEPQAIVMSLEDFLDLVAPPPEWLKSIWADSKRNGTDKLSMREIDSVIAEVRRDAKAKKPAGKPRR
jgi:prevent-host-death family protein